MRPTAQALAALRDLQRQPSATRENALMVLKSALMVLESAGLKLPDGVRAALVQWDKARKLWERLYRLYKVARRNFSNLYQEYYGIPQGMFHHPADNAQERIEKIRDKLRQLGVPRNFRKVLCAKYRSQPAIRRELNRRWSFALCELHFLVGKKLRRLHNAALLRRYRAIVPGKPPKRWQRERHRKYLLQMKRRELGLSEPLSARRGLSATERAALEREIGAAARLTDLEALLIRQVRLDRGLRASVRRRASELLARRRGRPGLFHIIHDDHDRPILTEELGMLLYGRKAWHRLVAEWLREEAATEPLENRFDRVVVRSRRSRITHK